MTAHENPAPAANVVPPVRGQRSGPEEQRLQGHWLLAKMGKRVLRPGGMEMTRRILDAAKPGAGDRIVEFGPGVGKTAEILLASQPERYWGVDVRDNADSPMERVIVGRDGAELVQADARDTGLPDGAATLVVGEAMLTMQTDQGKRAIMAEAYRVLAPGGRYAIHEMGFKPQVAEESGTGAQKDLSQTIKVGAKPLKIANWAAMLESVGFRVEYTSSNKMALLEVRRVIADEGILGFLRIITNVACNPAARKRTLAMRATFKANQEYLCAVGLVAVKPE